jgi:hypothetical protein
MSEEKVLSGFFNPHIILLWNSLVNLYLVNGAIMS